MAEAKNNFLGSKMNKDLEQRLVPNNEYRDANNVMISRSEGDDVGSLEIVLGNDAITNFGFDPSCDIEIIGYYMDQVNNRIFAFLTDYWDSSSDQLSNFAYGSSTCAIAVYNVETESVTRLVEGYWLNFSKTHSVLGVNLVEQQYLYFTDNRNQPRKINVNAAISNSATSPNPYYTCEDQISVSKYYPHQTPLLIKEEVINFTLDNAGTTGYTVGTNLPTSGGTGTGLTVDINAVNGGGQITDISIYSTGVGYSNGDIIGIDSGSEDATISVVVDWVSTMTDRTSQYLPDGVATNPTYDSNWSGDKDFLKDKFVRFAYRFKYDDGEYSLISPFTQSCFVPKQDGYFTGRADEVEAYTSTEVEFMENKINQIDIIIPSPYGTWEEAKNRFKISEIDIIFKRSDIQSLNVVESVKVSDPKFTTYESSNIFQYDYLAEKPYKTLPNNALLRVYDKVPVKALSQEFQENRIIYGNFLDKHTPPSSLDYFLMVDNKNPIPESQIRKEYQNHTLKQNRTYQAGVVLSDRYGRQSSVILTQDERNSIFNPYKTGGNFRDGSSESGGTTGSSNSFSYFDSNATDQNLLGPFDGTTITDTWPGDQLGLTFINTITLNKNNATGAPGLYNENGKVSVIKIINGGTGYTDTSYTNLTSSTGTGLGISITTTAGAVTGIVINSTGVDFEIGDSITLTGGGNDAVIEIIGLEQPNPLGWYSYKVVVKQTENEYYNIYHAGVLNGYIDGEGPNPGNYLNPKQTIGATLEDPTVHFALYGDNINKVPKDITLLGPNQNIFRTARPSLADDPSYYDFVDTSGTPFSVSPYNEEGQALLKLRDRRRDLDSGSQIQNAAVTLFPRVINFENTNSLPTPGNEAALFNKQWYPGTRVTTVTTIATGRELGLWDAAAPQPYNRAPVFYGYENNPLIAKATLEINKSISSANENWQEELDLYGANGPSPKAGKVIYNIDWLQGFTAGANYIAASKNINTKVKPTSSSIPTQGEDGQGIRVNIDKTSGGSAQGDEGGLVDKGVSIANDDSDPNVKGFDNPDFTYPYYVQLQVLGGDETGYIFLNAAKTEWPGFMQPYLSVHETQPIESKLDIYWETSTEGLIKDLNEAIINEDEFLPVRLGFNGTQNSSVNFFEDLVGLSGPIGTLQAYAADGNVINDNNVLITLVDSLTVNGNGTPVPGKFILLSGPNNYTKILGTNGGQEFVYEVDPLENVFTITCNVKAPTPTFPIDGTFTNTQLTATVNLNNVCPNIEIKEGVFPTIQTYDQPGGQNCVQTVGVGTTNFGSFSSAVQTIFTIIGKNGSADTARDRERITFTQNASPSLDDGYIRIFNSSGTEILSTNWWNGSQLGGGVAWFGTPIVGNSDITVTLNPGLPADDYKIYIRCSEGIAVNDINTNTGNDYLEFTIT